MCVQSVGMCCLCLMCCVDLKHMNVTFVLISSMCLKCVDVPCVFNVQYVFKLYYCDVCVSCAVCV